MNGRSEFRPVGKGSRLVLLTAMLVWIPAFANAEDVDGLEQVRQFHIDAQPLDAALIEFSAQADLQLMVASELVAGRRSPGVFGQLSSSDALTALLDDGDFSLTVIDRDTVAVAGPEAAAGGAGATEPRATPMMAQLAVDRNRTADGQERSGASGDRGAAPGPRQVLEEVVVTGSRITGAARENANPVTVIHGAQLGATGAPTLGALLQSIPQVAGTPYNSSRLTDINDGHADINLRGLGPVRTLVLLDGMRLNNSDVNSIPASMIDRVEVLTQGAGAIYGTDAIGGVVNFITRQDLNGVELSGTYGGTDAGGADWHHMSAAWGLSPASGGHALVGMNYSRQNGMNASERSETAFPYQLFFGEVSPNGFASGFNPSGRFNIAGTPLQAAYGCPSVTRIDGASGTSPDDFRCFQNNFGPGESDRYNFKAVSLNVVPQERYSLFGNAEIPVAGNVTGYATTYFTNTVSTSEGGPPPLSNLLIEGVIPPSVFGFPVISADNVYNPFGFDISVFDVRADDVGNRVSEYTTKAFQAMTGLRGEFGGFRWDLNYGYGQSIRDVHRENFLDISKVLQQLGPSFIDTNGNPACGTPAAPVPQCTPLNLFGVDGARLGSLSAPVNTVTDYDEHDISANFAGDLFDLPAGPLSVAVGAQYRKHGYEFRPDGLTASFSLSETNAMPTNGSYDVTEVYAEANIPIASDLPLISLLSANVGVRHSSYSTFGSTTDGKYALEWWPRDDLMFRASYADVYRAPNTNELFNGGEQSAPSYADPCAGLTNDELSSHPDACQNVPENYEKTQLQTVGRRVGNPDLKPETGYSTIYGVVFSPPFFESLTVTADRWFYKLEDAIQNVSVQSVLNACFTDSSSAFCGVAPNGERYLQRAENGDLSTAILPNMNSNRFTTSGWDTKVEVNYPTVGLWGSEPAELVIGVNLTYLDKFDFELLDPITRVSSANASLAGTYDPIFTTDSFPRLRGLAFATLKQGAFTGTLRLRHIGGMTESQVDVADNFFFSLCGQVPGYSYDPSDFPNDTGITTPGLLIVCKRDVAAVSYVDLTATYTSDALNADFTVGVEDLFDEGLATQYSLGLFGYHNPLYDVRGRSFYGRMLFRF